MYMRTATENMLMKNRLGKIQEKPYWGAGGGGACHAPPPSYVQGLNRSNTVKSVSLASTLVIDCRNDK